MADIKDFLSAEPVTAKEFFSSEKRLLVPPFQREYSWEKKEIEQFFDDVLLRDPEETYFIGSVILLEEKYGKDFEIIDGQQRATTISLIYASFLYICRYLQSIIKDEKLKSDIDILTNEITQLLKKESHDKLTLSIQKNNQEDFKKILEIPENFNCDIFSLLSDSENLKDVDKRRRLYKNFDLLFTKILDTAVKNIKDYIDQHQESEFLENIDEKWVKELTQMLLNFMKSKEEEKILYYQKHVKKHFNKIVKDDQKENKDFIEYLGSLRYEKSILYLIKDFSFEDTNDLQKIIDMFDQYNNEELAENCSKFLNKKKEDLLEALDENEYAKPGIKKNIEDLIDAKKKKNNDSLNEVLPFIHTFFAKFIEELKKSKGAMDETALVKMIVKNPSSANNLFETINYRGLPLSPMDLIKNDILRAISEEDPSKLNKAIEEWSKLVDALSTPERQIRYLRHFYMAEYAEYVGTKDYKTPKKSNIVDLYKKKFNGTEDRYGLFNHFIETSKFYLFMTNFEQDQNGYKYQCPKSKYDSLKDKFLDMSRFNAIPSLSMFLWLLKNDIDIRTIDTIYCEVKSFFIRRHIAGLPEIKYLDGYFEVILESFEKVKQNEKRDKEFIGIIEKVLKREAPSDEIVKEKLRGGLYDNNMEITRYLLIELNNRLAPSAEKESIDLWKKDPKDRFIFSIEHIIPQNDDIDDKWEDQNEKVLYWQNILAGKQQFNNRDFSQEERELVKSTHLEILHKLGNLTMTAYNSSLSDGTFKDKRDAKDVDGNFIGFKNGLPLNCELKFGVDREEKALCELDKFDKECVAKRGEKMVELIEEMLGIKTPL